MHTYAHFKTYRLDPVGNQAGTCCFWRSRLSISFSYFILTCLLDQLDPYTIWKGNQLQFYRTIDRIFWRATPKSKATYITNQPQSTLKVAFHTSYLHCGSGLAAVKDSCLDGLGTQELQICWHCEEEAKHLAEVQQPTSSVEAAFQPASTWTPPCNRLPGSSWKRRTINFLAKSRSLWWVAVYFHLKTKVLADGMGDSGLARYKP